MLQQLLIVVILYIIINQMIIAFNEGKPVEPNKEQIEVKKENSKPNYSGVEKLVDENMFGKPYQVVPGKYIVWTFLKPTPWTQIVYNYGQDFPFRFFIKVKIPSLNDYQTWKQIIPNIDFDAQSGELMIPARDEAGALAVANLIVSNFLGQLSIDNIIDKNLITISIAKAQQYEMVRNKLREQIMEGLTGKSTPNTSDFEADLAKSGNQPERFGNSEPDAYEGSEFSYL